VATRVHHLDAEFPENIERTPQGGAIIPARLTTSGLVRYQQPDGTVVTEYRSPEEVNDPESLATLAHIPVTLEHPGLVDRGNFREHTRGHVAGGSIQPQAPFITGNVVVQDGELLDDIAAKRRTQLSPGYNCVIDPTPGVTPQGEPFDRQQRKIRYNHVAVTVKGRQGPGVALRLDSEGNFAGESTGELQPRSEGNTIIMRKVTINGVQYVIGGTDADNEALERAITREFQRFDSENGAATAAAEKHKAELLAAVARAEKAEALVKTVAKFDSSDLQVMVKAAEVLGADYNPEGKTSVDIMRDIIAKAAPNVDLSGKSDEYVMGVFDGMVSEDGSEPAEPAETNTDGANTDPAQPGNPAPAQQPDNRQDSARNPARVHPSVARANLGATPLPGANPNPAPARPALSPAAQLRQDSIDRGRKPLVPQA